MTETEGEAALLRALVQEQLVQITELTRRLAEAEAARDASAEPHLLRAGLEALERRMQEAADLARAREAVLAAQLLADGAALDAAEALTERQQQNIQDLENKLQAVQAETLLPSLARQLDRETPNG